MAFYSLTLRACGKGLWRPILKRSGDLGGDLKTYIHVPDIWGYYRNIQIRGASKQSNNLYVVDQTNGNRRRTLQIIMNIGNYKNIFYYDLE